MPWDGKDLAGLVLKPGTVTVATLHHDAWCRALVTHQSLDCNCDPDITIETLEKPKT